MAGTFRMIITLLLLAALPAAVAAIIHPKRPKWERTLLSESEINLKTALDWNEKVLWVDARPREEFESGHIPGALLLNSYEWEQLLDPFLDAWNSNQKVVVYCRGEGCDLSTEVAQRLRKEVQIPNVYVLKGGWQAWHESQK